MWQMRRLRSSTQGGIAAVVGCTLAAFACTEAPEPIATITVGADRVAVPLGAPLDLQFRFDVTPDLEHGLAEDYRVFVHFLDDREEVLWTEDHDLPVPTSQWRSGQSIEYERRVKIPMYPYVGESVIAAGLYSVVDGTRVPLAGVDLGQSAYRVASIRLEPQHESSFVAYGEGWHPAEFSGDGRRQWRWTSDRGVLSFRNPKRDSRLILEFDGRPDMFDAPQRLSLVIGDRVLRELEVDGTEVIHLIEDLSATELGVEDFIELELRVDRTFTPADLDSEAQDRRKLGVRVFYTYFEPL